MKKLLCLVLCVLVLTGCAPKLQDPGNFYYRRTEAQFQDADSVIAAEERELKGLRGDLDALLSAYFSGPQTSGLENPFPRDTRLLDWNLTGTNLQLSLSRDFAQLSGVDLTIACACIYRTFTELTDVSSIRVRAEGALLNGSAYLYLNEDRLFLEDDGVDKLRTELTLYYTDEARRYLIGHSVDLNLAEQSNVIGYLVELLMDPPNDLQSPLPQGTTLLDCSVSDGICSLNFGEEFESGAFPQSYAQRITLLSLVNTLTQLPEIDKVEFQVDGSLLARYRQLSLSEALVFDESAIGPVRTGMNEFDATLYVRNGSEQYLAAVPTRVRQLPGITRSELVVEQLLDYRESNGFSSPIPEDTVLNRLTVEDGLCTIDLSREFLDAGPQLPLAVHAVIASVCALEDVEQAVIVIDGATPQGEYGGLFDVQSPSSNWYL